MLSEGQSHDISMYDVLMAERDSDPRMMLADKGYDTNAIRQDLGDRGARPEIPTKRNRNVQYSVNKPLYALRSPVEHCIGHLKEQRRVATRSTRPQVTFLGMFCLDAFVSGSYLSTGLVFHLFPHDLQHSKSAREIDSSPGSGEALLDTCSMATLA